MLLKVLGSRALTEVPIREAKPTLPLEVYFSRAVYNRKLG